MSEPIFPNPINRNKRLYFVRHEVENYKRALLGMTGQEPTAVIEWVPAGQVAKEFGFGRRTLGRRIAAIKAA
jgi:hypothetical protein